MVLVYTVVNTVSTFLAIVFKKSGKPFQSRVNFESIGLTDSLTLDRHDSKRSIYHCTCTSTLDSHTWFSTEREDVPGAGWFESTENIISKHWRFFFRRIYCLPKICVLRYVINFTDFKVMFIKFENYCTAENHWQPFIVNHGTHC